MREGWIQTTVGNVLRLEYGKPLDEADRKAEGRYPAYGANGEKSRTDRFFHDRPSIIVGRKGSAGEINLTEEKFWPLDVTYFVTFDEQRYNLKFLYHLLDFLDLPKLAKGVKPGINRNEVYAQTAGIPPLDEQQRIVRIIDEAFEGIATAKANAERNLANADDLFDSLLGEIFVSSVEDRPADHVALSNLCELIVDCEHKTAPKHAEGIPLIRTPNIGKGKLLLDGVHRVSESTYRDWSRRAQPSGGDLILAREAPAGNVAVIPADLQVCLGQRTVLIRPKRDIFDPEFLAWMLLQPEVQNRLLSSSRGATVEHVNMKDIRALGVGSVPPMELQRAVVGKIKTAQEIVDRLRAIQREKLMQINDLEQSILHRAFEGNL